MAAARDHAWANPASVHARGRAARSLLERARDALAAAVSAAATDVVFTSGGTEACNLGIFGLAPEPRGLHVVTTALEHPAVSEPLAALERRGAQVTELSVPGGRAPDLDSFRAALRDDTGLVAMQWVNHETGTVLPVAEYAALCAERGIPMFVDATQALGKVPVDLSQLPVSGLSVAAHKFGGPSGAGALIVRRSCGLASLLLGGGQERGRRAGTPGVEVIAGMGAACSELPRRLSDQAAIGAVRDRLELGLTMLGARINGAEGPRVRTVVNASFPGIRGADLVAALDLQGICCASGAACSSGLAQPSPVLLAMYPAEADRAAEALRLSLGPDSVDLDADAVLAAIAQVLKRMRSR